MVKTVVTFILVQLVIVAWLISLEHKIQNPKVVSSKAADCILTHRPATTEVEFRKAQRVVWVKDCKK